jgi:uncharacterized radical SAM protein YgiQ
MIGKTFLPVTAEECRENGWDRPDFVYVTGDAYVDHPSFGVAIISRVLEAEGFRVAILSQPDYKTVADFKRFGKPRLGFLVTSGNIDSMVAHYTVSKKKRNYDYYSPGGEMGKRPDRAVIVYCNRIREAYGDVPIIIGGLEASLRRFAHYDYWDDKVRRSILVDARADLLSYGMGEKSIVRIAKLLDKGVPVKKIRDVRGTVYLASKGDPVHYPYEEGFDYDVLKTDKSAYAKAFGVQYRNQDACIGKALVEYYDNKMLVQNPPMPVLEREELDAVYALPYTRAWHPCYKEAGGVPAINEVEFSITHNRGCFGACNFCALAFHQGRAVRSRSEESVVNEAMDVVSMPGFKGYIHDVGGPTANFRYPACDKQIKHGVCPDKRCLAPKPCPNLKVDHTEYARLLRKIAAIPKVKKVFVRSGIRFDYLIYDRDETFFKQLVSDHISGQLKVAPEHICQGVLGYMGKPPVEIYDRFKKRYFELTKSVGKEQYLVPYLMSSHPGSTLSDAVELALYLKRSGYSPEQVQDFYPTPGTVSTCMYYTGYDPLTMKKVEITDDYRKKKLQRALLQYNRPENRALVAEALKEAGREDLIGYGKECLIRPPTNQGPKPSGNKTKIGSSSKDRRVQRPNPQARSGAQSTRKPKRNKTN